MPAKAGIQLDTRAGAQSWTPASAGVTGKIAPRKPLASRLSRPCQLANIRKNFSNRRVIQANAAQKRPESWPNRKNFLAALQQLLFARVFSALALVDNV
jgi:hypothetical protein